MKILTNVTREDLGGITTTNYSLLPFLTTRRHQVIGLEFDTVRLMKGPIAFEGLAPEFFEHRILNIHDLPFKAILKSAESLGAVRRYFRPALKDIRQLMIESKPDAVLLNGTSFFPWLIGIAAHQLGIPLILRYRGVAHIEWAYARKKPDKKIKEMERSLAKMADVFIFPSRLCQDLVEREVLDGNRKKSYVIPNPVFIPTTQSAPGGGRRIAMVARAHTIKNPSAFFDLHALLKKQAWRHTATLITDPIVNKKKIPATIKVMPPMKYQALFDFFREQDLVIAPSFFETFGNVPMEAVSLGIPVLVSRNMGCAEILAKAGLEEMVVDFSDLEKVAQSVKALCGRKISLSQVSKVREMLSPEKISGEILVVLKEAVS